ncbi:GGDEF domain-containing protein [Pseudonocardia eucalypti]|uniref:GGDEF domain-containing protein n=1 Tax=Pseudonocardia eucalypti TaxID=648755 RepID=A0ABP9PPY5_9PSEU|nr:EAL domain-containing protein (putative c-di-GMP-specific phosphodiesterase class I) [Pseudonocardia eucalypti]
MGSNSYGRLEGIGFLFGSIANLTTGVVAGVEMLPRPRSPEYGEVLEGVLRGPGRTTLDIAMAVAALRWCADMGVRLPVHLNLFADTVASTGLEGLAELHAAVTDLGVNPAEVVIEIGAPRALAAERVSTVEESAAVLAGARRLREHGYKLLIDGVGPYRPPLSMISRLAPDQVKLHSELVTKIELGPGRRVLDEVLDRCADAGAEVIAEGIETPVQLELLRRRGVRRGQGPLLAAPRRRPFIQVPVVLAPVPIAGGDAEGADLAQAGEVTAPGTIEGFAGPATMVGPEATGEEVRDIFRDGPTVTGVVLVDSARRPVGTLDRNRFMLAVSGMYGHALHARRPVRSMADTPRTLAASAEPREALRLLSHGDPRRRNDDIVVVDDDERCIGVAHITDLLRGVAELESERARALHPSTGLGGRRELERALLRRCAWPERFCAGWLVPEMGPLVARNGFAGADATLRRLGRVLSAQVNELPGAELWHVASGLVVLARPEDAMVVDRAVRQAMCDQDGPELYSAWLTCHPSQLDRPDQVGELLGRLIERARALGSGTALAATPDTLNQPHQLRPLSAIRENPA